MNPVSLNIEDIISLLEEDKKEAALKLLNNFHPVDLAEVISKLSLEQNTVFIRLLDDKVLSNALIELEDSICDTLLEEFTSEEISKFLSHLDSDDAADIVGRLDNDKKQKVITAIKDSEHAKKIIELLRYEENTAGGLMGKELVSINENWDVGTALREIKKQAENVKKIHSIYVIDDHRKLKGRVSIKVILTSLQKTLIKDLYLSEIKYVTIYDKEEDVALIMSKYNLEAIPVTNEIGHLVGSISIDDIIDVMRDQAEKDYQMAAGITSDIEPNHSIWMLSKARLPWLLIGSIGGMGAASAISNFDTLLSLYPILIIFVPLIQSTAGNVGVQSSAIVVQGIASKTINGNLTKRLLKEIGVGAINGICITSLVLIISHFAFDISPNISLTVSISLITIILNAGIIGTFVPLLLNKYKIDPALATGPFITTGGDIIGIVIYFFIAKLILHL